jgi:hypothetical protein
MREGKLCWNANDRLTMLGLLLEKVGVDQAIRFSRPESGRKRLLSFGTNVHGYRTIHTYARIRWAASSPAFPVSHW